MTLAGAGAVAILPLVPTRALDGPLTYGPPVDGTTLEPGVLVEVPLGPARRVGVVVEVDVEAPSGVTLRPITRRLSLPAVAPELMQLAWWMAAQYGCARTVALALVVDPRVAAQARASAVPRRQRQLAARRVVDEVAGLDLTRRQRDIAVAVPRSWEPVTSLAARLSTTRATLGRLAERGLLQIEERFLDEIDGSDGADPSDGVEPTAGVGGADTLAAGSGSQATVPTLTSAQQQAVATCLEATAESPGTLLMGITGSGKTEVYLDLIERAVADGRGAIVLVPEIALTPQVARRFLGRFPGIVEVLHSGLTRGQRAAAWARIHSGAARVVVGPRSAVFAPVAKLGVIVVDEEHDSSYKQDSEPRYDARRVAWRRAQLEDARLVLGSATPRAESWHGVRRRARLLERPGGGRLAPVELVDLREHGAHYPITRPLQDAIDATLRRGRKAIVLHNRRGWSTGLHCRDCGTGMRCPRCDVMLVVHGTARARQRLACHHCGHDQAVPPACPTCASPELVRLGAGTERLEALLAERFDVPIFRLDADATRTRGSVSEILDGFAGAGPSILTGTQMVAKGHDFPDVEVAVVVDADAALAIPDFRAEERAFGLVTQLAGRAGRSPSTAEHGRVFVQSWNPEQPFLRFARGHDVQGFLERELEQRRAHAWALPPFARIVRVLISAPEADVARRWAGAVRDGLDRLDAGPALGPAALMRIADRERMQVLVSTDAAPAVALAVRGFLGTTERQRRREDVRIVLDVDPQSLS